MSAWHLFKCSHPLPCCSTIMLHASGLNSLGPSNRSSMPLIYGNNGCVDCHENLLLGCMLQIYGP